MTDTGLILPEANDLQVALGEVDQRIASENATPEDLVSIVNICAELKRDLSMIERSAKLALVAPLQEGPRSGTEIGGDVWKVAYSGSRKKWDHDRVFADVMTVAREPAFRADPETGELRDEVESVMYWARAAMGSPSWKSTELEKLGLDADDYSERDRTLIARKA